MNGDKTVRLVKASERQPNGFISYPGRRAIMVGAVLYGYINMQGRGGNGASFTFQQASGETIMEARPARIGGERHSEVMLWSDKVYQRNLGRDETPVPLDQRLRDRAQIMVDAKQLLPETEFAELVERRRQRARERELEGEREKIETLKQRARKAIAGHEELSTDELVARVVEAMTWAQSQ